MLQVSVQGALPYADLLQELKPAMRNRILRKTLLKAVEPARNVFKRAASLINTPDSTGALAGDVAKEATTDKQQRTMAIVGVKKRGWRGYITRSGRAVRRTPRKYLHLVDRGTKRSKAYHLTKNTWAVAKPQIEEIARVEIGVEIDRALAKY